MHRQRRVTSNKQSRKKGYKLGLSGQDAHLRTVKGWVTKHQRYKYASELHLPRGVHAETFHGEGEVPGGRRPHENPTEDTHYAKTEDELIQEHLDSVREAHRAPESLLREARASVARGGQLEDIKMAAFIAKAKAAREREIAAKLDEIKGADYARREATGNPDLYGNMVARAVEQVNPSPNSTKMGESHEERRRTLLAARKRLKDSFKAYDPATGDFSRDLVPEAHLHEIAHEIVQSHHAHLADDRAAAAERAKNLIAQAGQRAVNEIDRRTLVTSAAALERQARQSIGGGGGGEGGGLTRIEGGGGGKDIRKLTIVRPVEEQRLAGIHDIDEYYRYFGHEYKTPPEGSRASHVGKLKAQAEMMKQQASRRVKNALSGDLVTSWDNDKRRTGDHSNSLLSVGPNKKWRYTLNRSPDWRERHQGDPEIKRNVHDSQLEAEIAHTRNLIEYQRGMGKKSRALTHEKRLAQLEEIRASGRQRVEDAARLAHETHQKDLEYIDTKTQFHRAKRQKLRVGYDKEGNLVTGSRIGDIVPGDWEEVVAEKQVKDLEKPFRISLGERSLGKDKPRNVEEERFVVVPGLKKRSTKEVLYSGPSLYTERLVQLGGRWVPATQADWELRHGTSWKRQDRLSGAARYTEDRVYKHGRIHFIPEEEAQLAEKQRDKLSVRVPGFKVGSLKVGERVATLGLDESTDRQKRIGKALFGYSKAKKYHDLVAQSQESARAGDIRRGFEAQDRLRWLQQGRLEDDVKRYAENPPPHPHTGEERKKIDVTEAKNEMESHWKTLAAAGTAASLYGIRRKVKEGYAPQWMNNAIESFRGDHPGVDKWLTKHNAKFFAVNEAYTRPTAEKLANWGFMLRHPLSDPSGETMGVQWGRWKYRQHWIDEPVRIQRVIERRANEVERVVRTRQWFEENAYTDNPFKRFLVNRRDHLKRTKDYANFNGDGGLLDKAQNEALELRTHGEEGSAISNKANELIARVGQLRALNGNSPEMQKRVEQWTGSTALAAPRGKVFKNVINEVSGETQRVLANESVASSVARFAGNHRAFLVGAGVGAAALGTAYAIHKYRESKKPEAERVAFYNKILPPAFTIKTPHIRGTGYVHWTNNALTRELGVAGKKFPIPVRYGLSLEPHRIAMRPMDRGYPKNAPLFGGLRFRGPATGGSWQASLLENPEAKYNRRRSLQLKGQQVEFLGKKLPVYAEISDRKRMQLTSTNPNRLTQEDRENLVWAYAGTHDEAHVKNFYQIGKTDQRLLDMFNDPEQVAKIRRKKGTAEARQYADTLQRWSRSTPEVAPERGDVGDVFQSAVDQTQGNWQAKRQRMENAGVEWR